MFSCLLYICRNYILLINGLVCIYSGWFNTKIVHYFLEKNLQIMNVMKRSFMDTEIIRSNQRSRLSNYCRLQHEILIKMDIITKMLSFQSSRDFRLKLQYLFNATPSKYCPLLVTSKMLIRETKSIFIIWEIFQVSAC